MASNTGKQRGKDAGGFFSEIFVRLGAFAVGALALGFGAWSMIGQPNLATLFDDKPESSSTSTTSYAGEPVQNDVPSDTEIAQAQQESWQDVGGQEWSCVYRPTMNDDWHDDVECFDGSSTIRPILLPDSGFVTEDDMRLAGQEYETYLNSGGAH